MANKKQSRRRTVPLAINRGMWSGGDGSQLPTGYCRKVRNMIREDGSWVTRPNFTFDGLTGIEGLATWEDNTNKVTRLIAIDDSGNLRVKDIGAETWGAPASGTVVGTRLTSFGTYRGAGYGTLDDGDSTPTDVFRYDGTSVDTDPLNSNIVARQILFYKERMFLFHPRVTITNLLPWQAAYTASGGQWQLSDVDAREVVVGSSTIGEIIPTAPTGAFLYRESDQVVALAEPDRRVYLSDIHNTSASYQMPLTLQLRLVNAWDMVTAYAASEIVTPDTSNGFRYRAIVGGTSGVAEPAWPTTIGDTVTDGTITWLCDGENVLGERQVFVPTASNEQSFTRYVVEANLPPTPGEYTVCAYIVFGNDTSSTITPVALHIGLRDGLANGDPAKKNFGQQVTSGDYFAPFFNREDDTPAVLDLDEIIWSEVAEPNRIRAISSYNMGGAAGMVTAAVVFDGRIFVFKRRSLVRFIAVEDPNLVILPETDETTGVGCIGPRMFDIHPGVSNERADIPATLYWIAENTIYAMRAGTSTAGTSNAPRDICGDRMRAEIVDKGAGWLEGDCVLRVDQRSHTVWVMTQSGTIHVYDIADDAWSTVNAGGDSSVSPTGLAIRAFAYHPVTQNMYVSFGAAVSGTPGLARLDRSQSSPQVSMAVTGMVSFDDGVTFTKTLAMTLGAVANERYVPIEFPLYQSWSAIQTRMIFVGPDDDQIGTGQTVPVYAEIWPRTLETTSPHTDLQLDVMRFRVKAGATEFAVSEVEADLQLLRGYYPKSLPSFGGSSL